MIYTVTLNPALDRAIFVERLFQDDTTRVVSEKFYAAGKGIDVSRVIKELGGKSVAMGLVGGYDGLQLEGLLINAGVMTNFTRIAGETRTNIILKENATGHQFVISAPGPEIEASEIGQLYQHILEINDMTCLVLSGSLPRGVSPNLYGQLILAGKKNGSFILLDTDGKALAESIEFQPTAIKPNTHELARLVGRKLEDDASIISACREIHDKGVRFVLVSMGKDGLILSSEDQVIKAVAPPVDVNSTVGAGDSSVAGFVMAFSQDKDMVECARLACAAGTATAQTPGTELCHRQEVERILPSVKITSLMTP